MNVQEELRQLIAESRQRLAVSVNSTLTHLYWNVGNRRGFEAQNLRRMMQFSEQFPDSQIVATLSRQLSWSHFVELIPLKIAETREQMEHLQMHKNGMTVAEYWTELMPRKTAVIGTVRLGIHV